MSESYQIEIVTYYNASRTPKARNRIRLLALLSLAAAGVWLWATYTRVHPWLTSKHSLALANEVGALLFSAPTEAGISSEAQSELQTQIDASERTATIRTGAYYTWLALAYGAGAWLAIASMVGLLGWRTSLRMQRQAALLMLLSTLASIGGIWVAIRWGGMPPQADAELYAKIGAVQSSYAWFLLIATRLVR